jgi:hypothetical protein
VIASLAVTEQVQRLTQGLPAGPPERTIPTGGLHDRETLLRVIAPFS